MRIKITKRFLLSFLIMGSLILGLLIGLIFGYRVSFFTVIGDVFIGLLQMTVLPYIMFALIVSIGRSSIQEGIQLFKSGGLSLFILLSFGVLGLLFFPLVLPDWTGGSFYNDNYVLPNNEINFLNSYIPANLFESLSSNVIPAVVVFSMFLGVGVRHLHDKEVLLKPLDVLIKGLIKVNRLVIRLTPVGVFAIGAGLTSTLTLRDLQHLQSYMTMYSVVAFYYLFGVIPFLIYVLTPFSPIRVFRVLKPTLLTIFATGKIIVVLPQIIDGVKLLMRDKKMRSDTANATVDVVVPMSYSFPHIGNLLVFLFIPFAAWYMGNTLSIHDYPLYLSSSLLNSFVAPVSGLPFSLELMNIDEATLQFFVLSTVLNDRTRAVLGAMHIVVLGLMTLTFILKVQVFQLKKVIVGFVILVFLGVLFGVGLKIFLGKKIAALPSNRDRMNEFVLLSPEQPFEKQIKATKNKNGKRKNESVLARIKRTDTLRVGFYADAIPFSFQNDNGNFVGHSVDLAHRLASDLGVRLLFVPIDKGQMVSYLNQDYYDIVMSDIFLTYDLAKDVMLSVPYLQVSLSMMVSRDDFTFSSYDHQLEYEKFDVGYFVRRDVAQLFLTYFPNSSIHDVESYDQFFEQSLPGVQLDGMMTSAEKAYAFTIYHPDYKVVNPFPYPVKVDLVYPVAKDDVWRNYIDNWIHARSLDGTFQEVYDQWILGRPPNYGQENWNLIDEVLKEHGDVLQIFQ